MKKILIVDDDKEFVETVVDYLEENSFICDKAYCAQEAIAKLGSDKFDVIITDWNMPEENGLYFLKYVRASESFKDLLVVLMASTDEAKDWKEYGFDGYLSKPVGKFSKILELVNNLLEGK